MSKESSRVCFCFRRILKLRLLEPPSDVKILFNKYSQNGNMALEDLLRFLIEVQGEDNATKEDAQAIFNSLKHLNIFQRRGLHLEAFFRYLMSDINGALSPSRGVHHDMNAPLAHYFMFTGHNTYWTGNKLRSHSSVQPIIDALRRGVRVIELDLWPNSKKDDVKVYHGGTIAAPVDLIKFLLAIKDNAFHASEYPVVITFEDHLTPNLQAKVAEMVSRTFGSMLYCPESDKMEEFPSPESLKNKVMISTRPPKEYLETETSKEKQTPNKSGKSSNSEQWQDEKGTFKSELETNDKQDRLYEEEHIPDEDEEKAVPEYRNLIAIHGGKVKGPIENWLTIHSNKVRRLSLSEQELENPVRTLGNEIIRFTQRNLLRVYPKCLRLDSSNYNPFVGWTHGAQMVAFNMQGYGKHLWVMQGMFRANGGCGYVKKPDILLHDGPNKDVFCPYAQLHVRTILKVKVFMGEGWDLDFRHTHFDLYSPPDFLVKLTIAGVPADKAMRKTKVIEDDWLPEWNEEFEFPLTVPEFAVLRIEEYDTSGQNDLGGQTSLPISELRTGIRAVPLHDRRGDKYKSVRLLMQFEFA
ncbi:phosphoinositide phospholipase C 2 isoform X1 [Jatropha curcas]|uniref:phosphoinositide phospholipase C 2 isoform X1 n=1 Tax=Jatropha curcas TaxID=180498 RepID=UPI00189630F9|nr:phosphoinositide phospholipase C 2 isoform X1 [Jatropha curcas]